MLILYTIQHTVAVAVADADAISTSTNTTTFDADTVNNNVKQQYNTNVHSRN